MKVLVWNIQQFTQKKFQDGYVRRGKHASRKVYYTVAESLAYMEMAFTGNGQASHLPDVIAILEVLAPRDQDVGDPLAKNSPGANGLLTLLGHIKTWTGNNAWRLVPPLKCNQVKLADKWAQSEAVGVFYDPNTVTFQGPNEWIDGESQPAGVGATGAYPDPWNTAAVTAQTRFAGQVRFFLPNGRELEFPGAGNRRPFLVDFQEVGGAHRTIRFGFVHTSPGFHKQGTREFAHVHETRGDTAGDPPVTVFCGDFNVNDYNLAGRREAYRPLFNQRFWKMFTTAGQRSTHYWGLGESKPKSLFDYQQKKLIDNFLVRHKTIPAAQAATYVRASVNAVEGWPHPPYAETMHISLANLLTYKNPVEAFHYWENFWHIRKTSDHTPTFLDIQ